MKYVPMTDNDAKTVDSLAVGQMFSVVDTPEVVLMRVRQHDRMERAGDPVFAAVLAVRGAMPPDHAPIGSVCTLRTSDRCQVVVAALYEDPCS